MNPCEHYDGLDSDLASAGEEILRLEAELASLRQQLAEAKKDARRYRWLLRDGNIYLWFDSTGGVSLDILDAVIDTAMRGEGE